MGDKDKDVQPQKFDPAPLELAVLGYAIAYPHYFYEVALLEDRHFEVPAHKRLWGVLQKINGERGQDAIEQTLILTRMAEIGVPQDQCAALMVEASDYAPSSRDGIHELVEHMIAKAMRQALAQAAEAVAGVAAAAQTPDEMADNAMGIVREATRRPGSSEVISLATILEDEMRRAESNEGIEKGYPTGFYDLDEMTGGLHKGEMIVIAARPSVGKSAMVGNIAIHLVKKELPGVVFSLEMPRVDWARRAACAESNSDLARYRRGAMNALERKKVIEAMAKLYGMPLYIYDRGSLTMNQLASTCRRLVHERGILWAAIDYLQLMDHQIRSRDSTNDAVGRTSNAIKALARDLNIPIIALSQLNRAVETRQDNRPRNSDLRDSGSIEQDSDVIIFPHRPMLYASRDEQEQSAALVTEPAEFIVSKQRNGPIGRVQAIWVRSSAKFENKARGEAPPWVGSDPPF